MVLSFDVGQFESKIFTLRVLVPFGRQTIETNFFLSLERKHPPPETRDTAAQPLPIAAAPSSTLTTAIAAQSTFPRQKYGQGRGKKDSTN